ncbi:MAG: hypothetical protein ISQ32_04540 [Rickettsiales bacterium]|nr:hypothetical protein [Rickettsiales bacterium]
MFLTSCYNLSKDWQNNVPSYRYAPPYVNQNYTPYVPTPYSNPNNGYQNSYKPNVNVYSYYPYDYDSGYREPYRAYRKYESQQSPYYPPIDNDQSYYYNYPPRNPYVNQGYYQNNFPQNGFNKPNINNEYEVAR